MSLWKKTEKHEPSPEKTDGKKAEKPGLPVDKAAGTGKSQPHIIGVSPRAAIPGGEILIRGASLAGDGTRPHVRFGDQPGSLLLSASNRLIVRVPGDVVSQNVTVETGKGLSASASVVVGRTIAENLHPVANPALDAQGTFSPLLVARVVRRSPPRYTKSI